MHTPLTCPGPLLAAHLAPAPPQVNTSVYVTGLPDDTDVDEVAAVFSKCGILKPDDAGRPRICPFYTSDAADDSRGVALGCARLITTKKVS